jgi:hypothetical protein
MNTLTPVSGGHLARRRGRHLAARLGARSFNHRSWAHDDSARRDARLYGLPGGRRYSAGRWQRAHAPPKATVLFLADLRS